MSGPIYDQILIDQSFAILTEVSKKIRGLNPRFLFAIIFCLFILLV
jgi:hypothetical protein